MTKLTPENQQKVVVVLGMHRSGTSAVARVLNLLGVDLGSSLMPPAPSNVTGFWEHSEIVGINEKILEALGSDPFDPRYLSDNWKQPHEQIDQFKQLIFETIKKEFSSSSLWGIKDPRMCRLLPLWKPIFKRFNCQPLFVIVIRNPKEVAESLKMRDGLSIPLSYFLWMRYMMQAELDTRGEKRVFINYENLLADWKTVMSHISINLQLAWPKKYLDVESEVNDFLKSELRHHVASEGDIETGDILSNFVHKIYSVLLQMTHEGTTYPAVSRLSFLENEFSKMDRLGCVNGYLSFIERISLERNELRRHAENLQTECDHLQKHAKTLETENQALKGHAGNLQTEREHLQKVAKTLESENQALKGHAENLQTERDHLQKHAKTLESENQALKGHVGNLQVERGHLENHAKTLESENDNLNLLLSQRNSHLREIHGSLTWLLAGPVFSIERLLRETRKAVATKLKSIMEKRGVLFNEIFPTGDFVGTLESPNTKEIDETNVILVSGWLLNKKPNQLKTLILRINKTAEYTLTFGLERPDVAQAFPDYPSAKISGFNQSIPLDTKRHSLEMHIFAICGNDQRVCCFARKINIKKKGGGKVNWKLLLIKVSQKFCSSLREGKISLSPKGWIETLCSLYWDAATIRHSWQNRAPYQRWINLNRLSPKLLKCLINDAAKLLANGKKISVVVPIYNTPKKFLIEMIASVRKQIYGNWELCLVDDASTKKHVRTILTQAAKADSRIKVQFQSKNAHIVETTNQALKMATGEYVGFLDHDDKLSADALLHVARCIIRHPEVEWIYTDEDKINGKGYHYDPQFKGEWNPEMAITHNFTQHFAVIKRSLLEKVGRVRKGFEGAQDLDLFLRVAESASPSRIKHVPYICYHWRAHNQSTAMRGTQKKYIFKSAYHAIKEAIERRKLKAKPFLPDIAKKYGWCLYQLEWDKDLILETPVTVIIPTKDRVDLLRACIESLERTVNINCTELLIIDDNSTLDETQNYLSELVKGKVLKCRVVRAEGGNGVFNFSRLINQAVTHVRTPYVLFLNNDVKAIRPGWLEDMVGWMSIEGVGAVGAKLLYPDLQIQHAGVIVGPHSGLADHQFLFLQNEQTGYISLPHAARDVSAVTAACLLTSTALFREIGGFDEEKFAVQYNDVDYCLRLWEKGKRVVYSPQAELIHYEKSSRSNHYDSREHSNFINRYRHFRDPFFNINLDINSMQMEVDPHRFAYSEFAGQLKALLITHNLNYEGAPVITFEMARYFKEKGGHDIHVLSSQDGRLREKYQDLQIPCSLTHRVQDYLYGESNEMRESFLKTLGERLNLKNFDLVIASTLNSFWGVELAKLFNLPSIWHIHESNGLLKGSAELGLRESAKKVLYSCFQNATRVIFQANATRFLYKDLEFNDNFRTSPGNIDSSGIESFQKQQDKVKLRYQYSLPANDIIVTVVGTICERKGQHIFLHAISEIQKKESLGNVTFVLVGGRRGEHGTGKYLNFLYEEISRMELKNVHIFDETQGAYDFFALSDIFVCSSFEESFPVVLLEAMAFGLSIVSTNVFGIPEMISHEHEGILIPPGDPQAMTTAIERLVNDVEFRNLLAKNAKNKVQRVFSAGNSLKKHLALAQEAYFSFIKS